MTHKSATSADGKTTMKVANPLHRVWTGTMSVSARRALYLVAGGLCGLAAVLQPAMALAQESQEGPAQPAMAAKLTILHSFVSTAGQDGWTPRGGVTFDGQGALYGTTVRGGPPDICPATTQGCGTVYRLTPPVASKKAWKETVLYNFGTRDGDGNGPYGAVTVGAGGALFGTLSSFGPTLLYKLTPPVAPKKVWIETQLREVKLSNDPASSFDGLIADQDGAFYGTTFQGGANTGGNCSAYGCGTAFKLTPPVAPKRNWKFTVLHNFAGGRDGRGPVTSLAADKDSSGNIIMLYGTTGSGGGSGCGGSGCGTVYALTVPAAGMHVWKETVLHRFAGGSDGSDLNNSLTVVDGDLYGMTTAGGTSFRGTIFKLARPVAPKNVWKKTVLYNFLDGAPAWPGHLVADLNGDLYGMAAGGTSSVGVLFKLMPPVAHSKVWTQAVLYNFADTPDGAFPTGGLTAGPDGNFYGTTSAGGASNVGTVFKLVLP